MTYSIQQPIGIKSQDPRPDMEFQAGALASRHGLSVDVAHALLEECGFDVDCIDDAARRWKEKAKRFPPPQ